MIMTVQDQDIEILGATLLSTEEAEKLPTELKEYPYWWWLRSPGGGNAFAAYVEDNESAYGSEDYTAPINYFGKFVDSYGCVRPALIISLDSSNFKIGDCFKFGNKEFEIISNSLAFCKSDIGKSYFEWLNKNEDANDYEKSDVKWFVDKWFEEVCK